MIGSFPARAFSAAEEQLKPSSSLTNGHLILMVVILSALVFIVLVSLLVILSGPVKNNTTKEYHAAHGKSSGKNVWQARIDQVVQRFNAGLLNRDHALMELSLIARDFASRVSGQDTHTKTLSELSQQPRSGGDRETMDLFRQTIAALYPPEFANGTLNESARQTSVEEAAEWVSKLVDRRRR